jgi:hypothetical protein
MTTTTVPSSKVIRDLLEDLVGRDVEVKPGPPTMPTPRWNASVATYVSPDQRILAIVTMDLALSGWTAAALALLPPGGIQDAVKDGALREMHVEALYEVVNVLSVLFNQPGAPHAKLHRLYEPGEKIMDPDVLAIANALGNREDLDVKVAGYGSGSISLVLPFG